MDRLKRAVDSIEPGECTKGRLLARLKASSPPVRRRKLRPGVLIAAAVAAALLVTGAGAVYGRYFVGKQALAPGETPSIQFTNTGVLNGDAPQGYGIESVGPGWGIGRTLDSFYEKNGAVWNKLRNWDNDEYLGGSTRGGYNWTDFEVISGEGDILVRDVFDTGSKAVKREYISFNPLNFSDYLAEFINVDFGRIQERYSPLDIPYLFYTIKDRLDNLKGIYYCAVFAEDSGANFQLNYTGDCRIENLSILSDYVLAEEYDSAYTYTNSTGIEFFICAKDDHVLAECQYIIDEGHNLSSDCRITVDASFMTTADVEAVLDCIELNVQ